MFWTVGFSFHWQDGSKCPESSIELQRFIELLVWCYGSVVKMLDHFAE